MKDIREDVDILVLTMAEAEKNIQIVSDVKNVWRYYRTVYGGIDLRKE